MRLTARSSVAACLASFLVAAGLARAAQNPPPLPPIPGQTPLVDVDGRELTRGRLPTSTTEKARERWQKVLDASLPPGAERAPVTAFDLTLDVRYKGSSQSNDMPNARYQWMAPGYVRFDTGRGLAQHLRGPKGSFLLNISDPKDVRVTPLDVGRENAADRRKLDEEAGLASNFAALTDPQSIRVRKLLEIAAPPVWIPAKLSERAKALVWLEIESPDFYVTKGGGVAAHMARVALGVDALTDRVEVAVVDDAAAAAALASVSPSAGAAVLQLTNYKTVDGFAMPQHVLVWLPEIPPEGVKVERLALRPDPAMDMYVKQASLRAKFQPSDFDPPAATPK